MTVGDADIPWHFRFFCAVAFESQSLTVEKLSWSIWQSPVLPLWNFNTVDASDALRHEMFESASLVNQYVGSYPACSSFPMALVLASHRWVQGWGFR